MTGEITRILIEGRGGGREVVDRLFPLVYEDLKRVARARLFAQGDAHGFDTTSLVHEAYVRLADQTQVQWQDRVHFFAVASKAMRRILIDRARKHQASKRGGDLIRIPLDALPATADQPAETLLALDDALLQLAKLDERLAQVVEYRFFGGLTEAEIAAALGVTERTVRRDWVKAKGLLGALMGHLPAR